MCNSKNYLNDLINKLKNECKSHFFKPKKLVFSFIYTINLDLKSKRRTTQNFFSLAREFYFPTKKILNLNYTW